MIQCTRCFKSSPENIFLISDKTFSLKSDVMQSNPDYLSVDNRSSLFKKQRECFDSLEMFSFKTNDFIATMSDFYQWGKNCQIQTFDFSGFPISDTDMQTLSILSRLKIPEDWPQITSNFFGLCVISYTRKVIEILQAASRQKISIQSFSVIKLWNNSFVNFSILVFAQSYDHFKCYEKLYVKLYRFRSNQQ